MSPSSLLELDALTVEFRRRGRTFRAVDTVSFDSAGPDGTGVLVWLHGGAWMLGSLDS